MRTSRFAGSTLTQAERNGSPLHRDGERLPVSTSTAEPAARRSLLARLGRLGRELSLFRAAGAAVLTFSVWLSVTRLTTPGDWLNGFLLQRSLFQWLSVSCLAFGIATLVELAMGARRESSALAALGGDPEAWRQARHHASRAAARMRRVAQFSEGRGAPVAAHARRLAEDDVRATDERYGVVIDLVQLLPLIGFAGTTFGLSMGLYQQFLAAGGSSVHSFAATIATSFDTTLLAVSATIALIVLQLPLRRIEQRQCARLDQIVERWLELHAGAVAVPESREPMAEVGLALARAIHERLDSATTELGEALGEQLKPIAEAMLDTFKATLEGATRDACERHQRESAQTREWLEHYRTSLVDAVVAATSACSDALGKGSAEHARAVAALADEFKRAQAAIPSQVASVMREQLDPIAARVEGSLSAPRVFTLVEQAQEARS